MADSTIHALAAGSAVTDTDIFPSVETNGVGPVKKTAAQLLAYARAAIGYVTANTQTSDYTLVLGDGLNVVVEMNSSLPHNITVPPNSSVAFPVGTVIGIVQLGVGQVTLVAGGGVTLHNPSSLTTRAQYSTLGLRKRATDEWIVSGDLT